MRRARRAPAPPRPLDHVVLICGFPGSGKTFMLQALEKRHRARGARFVVHDRMGHWDELPGRRVVRAAEAEEAARVAVAEAPCTLVIDEAADAFPAHGWSPRRSPALNEVLKVGRQASAVGPWRRPGPVSLVMACQRPANVTPDVKSFINRLFIGKFPATATRDVEWLEDVARVPLRATLEALPFGRFHVVYL